MDWLGRAPEIREALVHGMVAALLEKGEVTSEASGAIARFTQPGQPISPALNKALLWRDVLAGNFTGARHRVGALASHDKIAATVFSALIQFLVGENAEAITGFREALKQYRNTTRRRRAVLPGPIGVFHPLALLRANEVRFHAEVRNLLDAALSGHGPVWSGYLAVRALFQVTSGEEDSARQSLVQLETSNPKDPLARALTSLARLHSDSDAERERVSRNEAAFDRIAAHLPLIGRIYAEVLARTSPDHERWSAILRTMRIEQVIAFTDIIGFKPKWERAFERLSAFLAPSTTVAVVDSAKPQKRLVFLIDRMTDGIEALEQAFRAGAWTPGRPVSMKRLGEQKLDYLSAADRRVLETMRRQVGWYGGPEYQFDERKSLLALIGHPHVFDAGDRRHVELVAYPAELVVSESSAGYVFKLSHQAAGPEIFIEEETPTRWRLIEVTEKLLALQDALGKDGLTVPPHMRERVIPLLRTDNPVLPIRSELPDVESAAVEGAPAPVLRLRRSQEALNINLVVRPIGPDGPSYVPGHGGRSVLAMVNGARVRVNRDLAKETAAAKSLIAGCTTLQPWAVAEFEWQIDGLEASLAFLEELESLPSPPALEWPEGEALKVTPAVGFKRLSLKVASARDWFEISGRITLDESLVLDMQEVLARLDMACGRFVPLSEGRFLALTADLKRQLQLLDAISDDSGHSRRVHPHAAAAVEVAAR